MIISDVVRRCFCSIFSLMSSNYLSIKEKLFLYLCTAFHASPNVYKRKTKEIRKETEPCGLDCFLLQVKTTQHSASVSKLRPHHQ